MCKVVYIVLEGAIKFGADKIIKGQMFGDKFLDSIQQPKYAL